MKRGTLVRTDGWTIASRPISSGWTMALYSRATRPEESRRSPDAWKLSLMFARSLSGDPLSMELSSFFSFNFSSSRFSPGSQFISKRTNDKYALHSILQNILIFTSPSVMPSISPPSSKAAGKVNPVPARLEIELPSLPYLGW